MAIQNFIDSIFGGREREEEPPVSEAESDEEHADLDFEEDELTVADLEHRIDELEGEIERTNSSIRGIESAQEDVRQSVEDMNDTVRRLLGVYDQLTADVNPFAEGGDGGFRFGVIDQPDGSDGETAPVAATESPADDDVVSFSDLEADYAAGQSEDGDGRGVDDAEPDDVASVEPEPDLSSVHPAERNAAKARAAERTDAEAKTQQAVCLSTIAESYAADLLIFEWLSDLVNAAGPAGALKALAYYEAVGWISPAVCDSLETVLGGPDLDVHIDPNRPGDLTASDHADSYTYILKLDALSDMDGTLSEEA